jgi:hypothetical protein
MRLTWNGDELKRKAREAAALAIDQTLAECVTESKAEHPAFPPVSKPFTPWANRTTAMTRAVRIFSAAAPSGPSTITGSWGSDMDYALFLEIGTSRAGPTATARADAAGGDPKLVAPEIGPLMARRHAMIPSSDRQYPLLAGRVRDAFNA